MLHRFFGGGAVAEDSGAGPGELSGPGPEEVSEEVTGSEPLPLMPQGSEYTTTYLSSGLAEKVARRAGREEVAAFDVVLTSIFTPDERAIALEVGEHGVSLRDPQGALIKVLPIEHLTGWGHKEDVTPCVFTLVVSEDLTTFDKMHFQIDTGKGAELEAALQEAAERRAEAVEKEQLAELEREEQRPSILRALSRAPSAIRKSLRDPSVSRRESENQFPGERKSSIFAFFSKRESNYPSSSPDLTAVAEASTSAAAVASPPSATVASP